MPPTDAQNFLCLSSKEWCQGIEKAAKDRLKTEGRANKERETREKEEAERKNKEREPGEKDMFLTKFKELQS